MFSRRTSEAAQRTLDRRTREDAAPRLLAEAPGLTSLVLTFREGIPETTALEHIRRVQVATAPALFAQTCQNRDCRDGGHDLTSDIMWALRHGETELEGESACGGSSGSAPCRSVLRYRGKATYRDR